MRCVLRVLLERGMSVEEHAKVTMSKYRDMGVRTGQRHACLWQGAKFCEKKTFLIVRAFIVDRGKP